MDRVVPSLATVPLITIDYGAASSRALDCDSVVTTRCGNDDVGAPVSLVAVSVIIFEDASFGAEVSDIQRRVMVYVTVVPWRVLPHYGEPRMYRATDGTPHKQFVSSSDNRQTQAMRVKMRGRMARRVSACVTKKETHRAVIVVATEDHFVCLFTVEWAWHRPPLRGGQVRRADGSSLSLMCVATRLVSLDLCLPPCLVTEGKYQIEALTCEMCDRRGKDVGVGVVCRRDKEDEVIGVRISVPIVGEFEELRIVSSVEREVLLAEDGFEDVIAVSPVLLRGRNVMMSANTALHADEENNTLSCHGHVMMMGPQGALALLSLHQVQPLEDPGVKGPCCHLVVEVLQEGGNIQASSSSSTWSATAPVHGLCMSESPCNIRVLNWCSARRTFVVVVEGVFDGDGSPSARRCYYLARCDKGALALVLVHSESFATINEECLPPGGQPIAVILSEPSGAGHTIALIAPSLSVGDNTMLVVESPHTTWFNGQFVTRNSATWERPLPSSQQRGVTTSPVIVHASFARNAEGCDQGMQATAVLLRWVYPPERRTLRL